MKQNIYDNPDFFKGYMDLRSNEQGFNVAIEEPAIYGLLPPLTGMNILDIGCGFGKFVTFCLENDAAHVLGTDISENMISESRKRVKDPRAFFLVSPVEELELNVNKYDIIVSSMCFHYIENIKPIFNKLFSYLKPNGHFIFSVEHPICTSTLKGWYASEKGNHWPVDDYKKESKRISNWFIDGVIKYHRTIETYVNDLIDSGFSIRRLLEPGPSNEAIAERPELSEHMRRPPILVIASIKSAQPDCFS
jgi:ubiquinone/menaquinone biosynthesis C-methylase UbiE